MQRKYRNPSKIQPRNKTILPEQVVSQHRYYASVQQQAYENAIKAGGIRATIYNPLSSGIICSCDLRQEIVSEPDPEDVGDSDIENEHNFYRKSERTKFAPKNLDLSDLDIDDDFKHHALDDRDDIDEGEEVLDIETIDLSGFNQNKCNICYGTGFVGGYTIPKGFRRVLDTQHEDIQSNNASIEKTTNPYQFEIKCTDVADDAYVEFRNVFIPNMQGGLIIRLWNNLEEIVYEDGLNKIVSNDSDVFRIILFDPERIDAERNTATAINSHEFADRLSNGDTSLGQNFHVRVQMCATDRDVVFTHVEMQIVKEKSFIDMAQFSEEDEPLLMANLLSTTINFLPDSGIQKFSVVNENKYNRAWQIKSVTPHKNHDNVVVSYECDARRIEPHEIYSNLLG